MHEVEGGAAAGRMGVQERYPMLQEVCMLMGSSAALAAFPALQQPRDAVS